MTHHVSSASDTPKRSSRLPKRTAWRAVSAMFMLNGAFYGMWAARIPAFAEQHQLGEAVLGFLLLSMAAGAIVSFPLAGRLSDQLGCARMTKRIAYVYGFTLIALALAPNALLLALALFLFGAAHGSMDVSMNAWGGEVERSMGRPVMSSFHAMWSMGTGLGAASGFWAASHGMAPLLHFTIGASLMLLLTLPFGLMPWQSDTHYSDRKGPLFPFPKGALLLVGILAFSAALGEGGMGDWSALFLVSVADVGEAKAALGFTVFSAAMVLMRFAGDYVIARFGSVRTARIGAATAGTGALLAIVVGTLPASLAGFAMMGLGYAVLFPLAFSRAANDGTLAPGAAIASVATLGYGGGLVGPVIIGLLAGLTSIRMAFLILPLLALVIILLASVLSIPARKSQ
jgi:MFS family permease